MDTILIKGTERIVSAIILKYYGTQYGAYRRSSRFSACVVTVNRFEMDVF